MGIQRKPRFFLSFFGTPLWLWLVTSCGCGWLWLWLVAVVVGSGFLVCSCNCLKASKNTTSVLGFFFWLVWLVASRLPRTPQGFLAFCLVCLFTRVPWFLFGLFGWWPSCLLLQPNALPATGSQVTQIQGNMTNTQGHSGG